MSSKIQNVFVIVGIIAIGGFGFYLFTSNGDVSLQNEQIDNQAAAETAVFLSKLNELKRIQLQGEILNDKRFISLVDSSQIIVPVPVGKTNPFTENN